MGLLGNSDPYGGMSSLLGIDPKEMRRRALFNGLAAAGFQLMGDKNMGNAGLAFVAGTDRARDDYYKTALDAYRLKTDEEDREWRRKEWEERTSRQAELDKQNAWRFRKEQDAAELAESQRLGQQSAVKGFAQDFTSQGGDLFSPGMQSWLRGQGVSGVDPADTQRYNKMQPYMQAQNWGGAFEKMTADQSPPDAPTIQKFRDVDLATGEPVEITAQYVNGQWVEIARGPAFNPNAGVKIDNRQMGNIPPGYAVEYDDQSRPVRMSPIPGSPDANKAAAEQAAQGTRREGVKRSADVVIEDIDRTLALVDTAAIPATGAIGSIASKVPGTAAHDISQLVLGIRANIGFDRLQRMREESPTGGALGQVAVQEIEALQASFGSLAQSQTEEQFKQNLVRLRELYLDIIHGPGNRPYEPATQPGGGDSGAEEWTFDQNGNPVRVR